MELQVSSEKTVFMQKATYYLSRFIAARGIIELTDLNLYFQVSPFDASFGIKDLSIDLCSINDVKIEGGQFHPKIVVVTENGKYTFVLTKAQELYDQLRKLPPNPLKFGEISDIDGSTKRCSCGKNVRSHYYYCPWCGTKL